MPSEQWRDSADGASMKGHLEVVNALLAKSADVNARTGSGATALILAARSGHTEICRSC